MQGERYGMTTGESGQNVDPNSPLYQEDSPSPGSGKKKSMVGKVKDKAKKFKTKMKAKKAGSGNGDSSSSSGDEEEDSEQSPMSTESPGVKSSPLGAFKDRGAVEEKPYPPAARADNVEERFGELNLGPKPPRKEPRADELPKEEGYPQHGRDLTGDQKLAGAAVPVGLAAPSHDHSSERGEKDVLDHARDVVNKPTADPEEGKSVEGQPEPTATSKAADPEQTSGEINSPSYTTRATNTVMGLKDTVASKLGYGSSPASSPTAQPEGTNPDNTSAAQKSYMQKAQEMAVGGKDAVMTKFGYGGTPGEGGGDSQKSYVQKAHESAAGAKDTVASKVGQNTELSEAQKLEQYQSPSRFHPGLEDKALSTVITDAVSNSASNVKNSVMGTFSGSPKPPTPSAPSDEVK